MGRVLEVNFVFYVKALSWVFQEGLKKIRQILNISDLRVEI
jgi:hypothetical protein